MKEYSAITTSVNETWNDAFNNGDIEKLVSLYAEDATLSPGNGQALVGRDAIANLFQSFIDAGVHDHSLETVTTGGDENTIFQVARWSAKGGTANGETPEFGGITMNVLEKNQDGKWVTRAHVWNASP